MRLTLTSKIFIALIIVGSGSYILYKHPEFWSKVAPEAQKVQSNVPPTAVLPEEPAMPAAAEGTPGCAKLPEVRFYHWARNAQMGMMLATGGKQAADFLSFRFRRGKKASQNFPEVGNQPLR